MTISSGKFRFRPNANIGAPDAEQDTRFLKKCFVDTGALDVLLAVSDPRCLLVGRTGSGKTALLELMKDREQHVVAFSPFSLAIEHVTSSQILRLCADSGVNLSPFFKLLWRHVFVVEIIRERYGIHTRNDQQTLWQRLTAFLPTDRRRKEQLAYLEKHGPSFWNDPDERIKEVTKTTETELSAKLSGLIATLNGDISGRKRVTEEQKKEIAAAGQDVVSAIKIRDLNEMFDLLKNGVLANTQQHFYIVIDALDEEWVEDGLKYRLIKALIETIREFRAVKNCKIIVCIRTDLIDRVLRITRTSEFQEEKIQGMYLHLMWTREQMIALLNRRIAELAKDSFTSAVPTHLDVLPDLKAGTKSVLGIDYILSRTMMRPRDMILFFNECITQATDAPKITKAMLRHAEGVYSKGRLRSLGDEWYNDYPDLVDFLLAIFTKSTPSFKLGALSGNSLDEGIISFLETHARPESELTVMCEQYFIAQAVDAAAFRKFLATTLYRVGFLGLKTGTHDAMHFSDAARRSVSSSDVTDNTTCQIHAMYWRALGIAP